MAIKVLEYLCFERYMIDWSANHFVVDIESVELSLKNMEDLHLAEERDISMHYLEDLGHKTC